MNCNTVSPSNIVPFAALFTEPGVAPPTSKLPPYSEEEQCGMWDPGDGNLNPFYLSNTTVYTNHGDSIGDEA